ncbi:hypothetical protein Lsha_0094 [Legionella shakespearei DSM 23087]|uniref:Uncharacterized protein n=1 Tax=Legionella shakespearei DSM 23087 TaxID=1122169 RepID=A0A0W0ZB75_9GAMM|nr:hypothetical protein Lsha_0094 [Legionella shakespearei DSM 23087]
MAKQDRIAARLACNRDGATAIPAASRPGYTPCQNSVVLSASFCAKDLLKVAWCQYLEILRAKRRAQDDVDRGVG